MDFLVVAVPWLLIGYSAARYRAKRRLAAGLEMETLGEVLVMVWDTLWGPLTWFFMFRP